MVREGPRFFGNADAMLGNVNTHACECHEPQLIYIALTFVGSLRPRLRSARPGSFVFAVCP